MADLEPPADPTDEPAFLALVGPTASGKSELGLALARALDGEIISADSRQVYRGLDRATAKPSPSDRESVPHHGLDLRDPGRRYSAGQFGRDARGWVREIRDRGRVPLVVGGTGFFLQVLLDPIFREPPVDRARRDAIDRVLSAWERERLEVAARALDPDRFEVARAGGPSRLIRTIGMALLTGRPLSWWHRNAEGDAPALDGVVVRLTVDRAWLDTRIEARAREMWNAGLLEEVEGLVRSGLRRGDPGLSATGYPEALDVLEGKSTPAQALERTILRTRQFARRQESWFRHRLPGGTLMLPAELPLEERVDRVAREWVDRGGWSGPGARTASTGRYGS